jgi:hypothetical protein
LSRFPTKQKSPLPGDQFPGGSVEFSVPLFFRGQGIPPGTRREGAFQATFTVVISRGRVSSAFGGADRQYAVCVLRRDLLLIDGVRKFDGTGKGTGPALAPKLLGLRVFRLFLWVIALALNAGRLGPDSEYVIVDADLDIGQTNF